MRERLDLKSVEEFTPTYGPKPFGDWMELAKAEAAWTEPPLYANLSLISLFCKLGQILSAACGGTW